MTTDTPTHPHLPLVCDLTVLTAEQRRRLENLSAELFGQVNVVEVLDNGYDITFPDASPETLKNLAEFVAYDSLCCAFLRHTISIPEGPGPAHLVMTGRDGAREVIAGDLASLLPPEVASAIEPNASAAGFGLQT